MTSKMSLVLAAFTAGIVGQPIETSATPVQENTADTRVLSDLAQFVPSAAAVDKLKGLIQEAWKLPVYTPKPFPRVFVQENGPSFVRSIK
jgi:hypothetical protein